MQTEEIETLCEYAEFIYPTSIRIKMFDGLRLKIPKCIEFASLNTKHRQMSAPKLNEKILPTRATAITITNLL